MNYLLPVKLSVRPSRLSLSEVKEMAFNLVKLNGGGFKDFRNREALVLKARVQSRAMGTTTKSD